MLGIQTIRFIIGTKIPFSDFPKIVQSFLDKHNLHYKDFLYYFEDNYGGLPKALKDCPKLGPIRTRRSNAGEMQFLSNIPERTECTKDDILSLMPKIHRQYGFSDTYIIYQDIDFFSIGIPSIVQSPGNTPDCIHGAGIECYRSSVFPRWNSIDLHIIIYDGHNTFDPTPYMDSMKQLLPGIRTLGGTECYMTEEEQEAYNTLNQNALSLVKQAHKHLTSQLPNIAKVCNHITPTLSAAPVLKRLCKDFGYTYVKHEYATYFLQKRTPNGHYILLDIDIGRAKDVGILIRFAGMGFEHRICCTGRYPESQEELVKDFSQIFSALASAEQTVIPALDAHFPPTPDWFTVVM